MAWVYTHPRVINKRYAWRVEDRVGAVYVGRPSRFGNPWTVEKEGRYQAILNHAWRLNTRIDLLTIIARELPGRFLSCWCAPLPCHTVTLARIADGEGMDTIITELLAVPEKDRV